MGHTILDRRSVNSSGTSLTQAQVGFDRVAQNFQQTISDPTFLPAMAVGSAAYRLGKLTLLEGAAAAGITKFVPRIVLNPTLSLAALGGEVSAFRASSNVLGSWAGHLPTQSTFHAKGWSGTFTDFLFLKTFGRFGASNPILAHAAQSHAMVLGHEVSARLGFTDAQAGSYVEKLAHAEATNLGLGAGVAFMHVATRGSLQVAEKAADARLQSFSTSKLSAFHSLPAPQLESMAANSNNTRVNGPVLEVLNREVPTSQVPQEGFMGHMSNPADGFRSFILPDGTRLSWIGSPKDYPAPLDVRLSTTWNNALGAVLVANSKLDAMGLIVMHGAMLNGWAPDASLGQKLLWRGLGGMMAFTRSIPHERDLNPLLRSLNLSPQNFNFERLTPEQQAWVSFLGAAEKTQGKALGMTPKWRFIDANLAQNGFEKQTGLGGMKSVVLHAPGDAAKKNAVEMMARAAKVLGIYISGGDEGTAQGNWTDIFAKTAPMNMAGTLSSHPLLQGPYPSPYTARGVFEGLWHFMVGTGMDVRNTPVLFQGTGGVGQGVLRLAIQQGVEIAGASDILIRGLIDMRDYAVAMSPRYKDVPWFWDRQAARAALEMDIFAEQELLAAKHGLPIVNGLQDAITQASFNRIKQGHNSNIPLLSPNATSHQVDGNLLASFQNYGGKAIIGGANNMLELGPEGSYLSAAREAVERDINVPNDSRQNQEGARTVLAKALGISEEDAVRLAVSVGQGTLTEYQQGHLKGIPPQVYSDREAQRAWNALLDAGLAIGGRFDIP